MIILDQLRAARGNRWLPAEDVYFRCDREAAKVVRRLGRAHTLAKRACLLCRLASEEQAMANICTDTEAFGGDQNLGRDLALSAQLIRLVANAARAAAGWPALDGPLDDDGDPLDYQPAWVADCAPILADLGRQHAEARADLLDQMRAAVLPHVGPQAAEVLVTLARCERQVAARRRWRS
jgi:hypothetical protein